MSLSYQTFIKVKLLTIVCDIATNSSNSQNISDVKKLSFLSYSMSFCVCQYYIIISTPSLEYRTHKINLSVKSSN